MRRPLLATFLVLLSSIVLFKVAESRASDGQEHRTGDPAVEAQGNSAKPNECLLLGYIPPTLSMAPLSPLFHAGGGPELEDLRDMARPPAAAGASFINKHGCQTTGQGALSLRLHCMAEPWPDPLRPMPPPRSTRDIWGLEGTVDIPEKVALSALPKTNATQSTRRSRRTRRVVMGEGEL